MQQSIVFVGGGNMARSLISGLSQADDVDARVTVIEPDADKRAALDADFDVHCLAEADAGALDVDVLILAVKPQVLQSVAGTLAEPLASNNPLIVSIAAGIPIDALERWLGDRPLVRCMPNTPALIGAGMTALYANARVSRDQRAIAETILAAAGAVVWVDDETQLAAVTATSGSGPAYFFAFMEAMQSAAEGQGLAPDMARQLVLQTAFGAARMAIESDDDPGTLRANVTSPGGTTEAALKQLSDGDLAGLVARAMDRASTRADELGHELSSE